MSSQITSAKDGPTAPNSLTGWSGKESESVRRKKNEEAARRASKKPEGDFLILLMRLRRRFEQAKVEIEES